MVVLQIIDREGELGAGAIAASARLSQATLTALLDKLEARGAVRRRRASDDRRRVAVSLTDAGREVLRAAPDGLQQRFASRFDQLKDWEQAGLVAALERIAVMMDAEGIDASAILDVGSIDRPAEPQDLG